MSEMEYGMVDEVDSNKAAKPINLPQLNRVADEEASDPTPQGLILRIEGNAYKSFDGVRSCGDADRVKSEATAALERWVKEKMFENRALRWVRFGYTSGTSSYSNSREPWPSNRRSCRGSVTLNCYIEFKKA